MVYKASFLQKSLKKKFVYESGEERVCLGRAVNTNKGLASERAPHQRAPGFRHPPQKFKSLLPLRWRGDLNQGSSTSHVNPLIPGSYEGGCDFPHISSPVVSMPVGAQFSRWGLRMLIGSDPTGELAEERLSSPSSCIALGLDAWRGAAVHFKGKFRLLQVQG